MKSWGSLLVFVLVTGTAFSGSLHAAESTALCDEARRNGDYRQAAECYRQAGDLNEADKAHARAFAETSAASTKRAAATIVEAKAQARRIREALRSGVRS